MLATVSMSKGTVPRDPRRAAPGSREPDNNGKKMKTYSVRYLPPKAIARYIAAGGTNVSQFIRENNTLSGVKHLAAYASAADAQAVADKLNAEGSGKFAGVYFHVLSQDAEPALPAPRPDLKRLLGDLEQDFQTECQLMGRRFAEESDAFARRVLGVE